MVYTKQGHLPVRSLAFSAFILLALIAGALLWSNRPRHGYTDDAVARVREARSEFEQAPAVALEVARRDEIADAILSAPLLPNQLFTYEPIATQRDALASFIAPFLLTLADADADKFARLMSDSGYRLTETGENVSASMPRGERWDAMHEYFTGEPWPADGTVEDFFVFAFDAMISMESDRLRPTRLAIGEIGARSAFRRIRNSDSLYPLEEWTDDEHTTGGATVGCVRLWAPPVSLDYVIERDGEADTVVLILPLMNARREWIPLTLALFWDQQRDQWFIQSATISNTLHAHLSYVF